MAEEVNLEAVLEFLRKNGFSECESALMEDVVEKSHLGSSSHELHYFFFPMVPPPPPPPPELGSSSDDDEFVSLGSSTTELCSSEFTNPYGIRTTRPASQASSDRLSQFGTARDYPDFDMQSDLFWYKERDDDYSMPPLFVGRDHFYRDTSEEDKYVMTIQTGKYRDKLVEYDDGSLKRAESWENSKDEEAYRDCYELGNLKGRDENGDRLRNSPFDWLGRFDGTCDDVGTVEKDVRQNENYDDDFRYDDEMIRGEIRESKVGENEVSGALSDEIRMHRTNKEDDYEIFNLRIIHRKHRTGFEENRDFPIVINTIIAGRYCVTEFLGSAAFSKVVQAHDLYSGMAVCLKIIKNDRDFFNQSLDEIKLLKFVNKHDPADKHHTLRLYDYFYHQEHLFIVTELLKANLYVFQKYNRESGGELYFTMHRLQVIATQCLEALSYLHDLGIIHCDLKPENILIKSYRRCKIKVIDLGSSCFKTDNLSLYVQSRSYRAPEVMLGIPHDQRIDLWSVGCILAELCSGEVLFPNEAVVKLLSRMVGMFGPIDMEMLLKGQDTHKYFTKEYDLYSVNEDTNKLEYIAPEETCLEHQIGTSDSRFIDFLKCLLEINPKRRFTAREALLHPWLSHSYI